MFKFNSIHFIRLSSSYPFVLSSNGKNRWEIQYVWFRLNLPFVYSKCNTCSFVRTKHIFNVEILIRFWIVKFWTLICINEWKRERKIFSFNLFAFGRQLVKLHTHTLHELSIINVGHVCVFGTPRKVELKKKKTKENAMLQFKPVHECARSKGKPSN